MGIAFTVCIVLLVIASVALIALILMQRGKGGGLVAFGGGGMEQAFGTHAATFAQKATVVLAVVFVLLSVAVGMLYNKRSAPKRGVAAPMEAPAHAPQPPVEE